MNIPTQIQPMLIKSAKNGCIETQVEFCVGVNKTNMMAVQG
jgi:hypothetical protein